MGTVGTCLGTPQLAAALQTCSDLQRPPGREDTMDAAACTILSTSQSVLWHVKLVASKVLRGARAVRMGTFPHVHRDTACLPVFFGFNLHRWTECLISGQELHESQLSLCFWRCRSYSEIPELVQNNVNLDYPGQLCPGSSPGCRICLEVAVAHADGHRDEFRSQHSTIPCVRRTPHLV